MRFRIRVARVQSVERVINATDEQAAIGKIESELQRPYGMLAAWTTVDTQIEIVGTEPVAGVSSAEVGEGPLLLSVAAAAKHLGLSRGSLCELINRGEIEHVRIGRRILIERERLKKFIEVNSRTGYDAGR
jgi:excisionase family DNA binding protein